MDTRTYDNIQTVGDGEFPFYENHESKMDSPIIANTNDGNAVTLQNYRLSRASAPSPNTIIPLNASGKFPASVIPAIPATTIYSRDGLTQYTLVVEANGALSIDPV